MRTDYGEHLNEHGEVMCRMCRLFYTNEPGSVKNRMRVRSAAHCQCPFCNRMARILKESEPCQKKTRIDSYSPAVQPVVLY